MTRARTRSKGFDFLKVLSGGRRIVVFDKPEFRMANDGREHVVVCRSLCESAPQRKALANCQVENDTCTTPPTEAAAAFWLPTRVQEPKRARERSHTAATPPAAAAAFAGIASLASFCRSAACRNRVNVTDSNSSSEADDGVAAPAAAAAADGIAHCVWRVAT